MARFRGVVSGGRGETTRLGHATRGLMTRSQSMSGDVIVRLYVDERDQDCAEIYLTIHGSYVGNRIHTLWNGPIGELANKDQRVAKASVLVGEILRDAHHITERA